MIDIKPCPFCKCDCAYVSYQFYKNSIGTSYEVAWVTCACCDAQGPHESMPSDMSVQEAAIKAWNER